jgi:hypothetical protein
VQKHAKVAIATFADDEEEALISGKALVRKYLDIAFGEQKSKELIPGSISMRVFMPCIHFLNSIPRTLLDVLIEAWNPDNKDMRSRLVGKNYHLEALMKQLPADTNRKTVLLVDDSERNCILVRISLFIVRLPCVGW